MSHTTWVPDAEGSPFGIDTLPYGVCTSGGGAPAWTASRIGDRVLDLAAAARTCGLAEAPLLDGPRLNPLMAAGPATWSRVRDWLTEVLTDPAYAPRLSTHLHPLDRVRTVLPFAVADYVDFYASEHHATNVGRLFRPDGAALPTSWRHLPIGYHGRAGTVVASGTEIIRPHGQRRPDGDGPPLYGPCVRLDLEAEVGVVVGLGTEPGVPVPVDAFGDHAFGVCLVNDWSARDLQAWEYVPLGPFLGKSFATSISPWIVPLAALESARVQGPPQEPPPLPHLRGAQPWGLDLALEVTLNGTVLSRPPAATLYWTVAQQLAHLTSNGARLRTGDLQATGTISGPRGDQLGSLLELTRDGAVAVRLDDGTERRYLSDGDRVTISATAPGPGGGRIGLGEVTGTVVGHRPD